MQFSSKLTITLHILLTIYKFQNVDKVTSTYIAESLTTNPVIIRNILGKLKKSGIISVETGVGGAKIIKNIEDISLLDIFLAIEDDNKKLFLSHDNVNTDCPVGANVKDVINPVFNEIQIDFENSLRKIKFSSLCYDLDKRIK
ncbi:Rrf2 family transcriptional regulator [Gemella sp. zg-1178]|uniref:Rrf2 family transcriptional regulator n=1 Tax=Gemella sp. zg-1178 TaxID=2840372 RepID=UPI001C03ED40|nr:Rrf2 family transcriptional regulator [Gemella sp. zg-1178]MBU0278889.1 Rrf2 family transcriptional regulator [Gemella sp. zg-1178]